MLGGTVVFALITAVLVAALTARRIEHRLRRHRAETPGPEWAAIRERIDAAHPLLAELTITRFGYDRQVLRAGSVVRDGLERILVQYNFASGFGENRQLFQSMILACPVVGHGNAHAIITSDDRIASAAMAPGWRRVRIDDRWWIVNDADELPRWQASLNQWLKDQPADRNMECHPGLFALYQSGSLTPETARLLSTAADRLFERLTTAFTKG